MALSALDDRTVGPTREQVASVLGPCMPVWDALAAWLEQAIGMTTWEWGCSGAKYGWALRAKLAKRTIAYLIPQHGRLLVGLVLGDRALRAARNAALQPAVAELIAGARRYAEGTARSRPHGPHADGDGYVPTWGSPVRRPVATGLPLGSMSVML